MMAYLLYAALPLAVALPAGAVLVNRVVSRARRARLQAVCDHYAFREIVRRERKRLEGW